jgi:hypothetical protein
VSPRLFVPDEATYMAQLDLGDVIQIGADPQRWKIVTKDGIYPINAWELMPVDESGEEITLQEVARLHDARTGRTKTV